MEAFETGVFIVGRLLTENSICFIDKILIPFICFLMSLVVCGFE